MLSGMLPRRLFRRLSRQVKLVLVRFSLVATMQLTDDELVAFFQHVQRLVDQLDVVKIVSLVAFIGKRILVILQGGTGSGNNGVCTFRWVCSFERRDSHSSLIVESSRETSLLIESSYLKR